MTSFDRVRYRRHDASVFLYAFDLIELNGDDLRRDPPEVRKDLYVLKAFAGAEGFAATISTFEPFGDAA
jgi:ATP-dependent DNA ligase